jgi:SAM-dependent methyltransferase
METRSSATEPVRQAVKRLYDTYPFPPDPLSDDPPPGYNWRWHWQSAYNFCLGKLPKKNNPRILDAGCGTGVSTEYLLHLNPEADVTAIDISTGALAVAKERCRRSGVREANFQHLSLFDADTLPGQFDLINSVGVLHHTADPKRGIKTLADKLLPGGLFHIFVYGQLGRWEIQLMQEAIGILQGDRRGDYTDGVQIGRKIFSALPENNRLVTRERDRWSWENQRDESFADMYVHPQEIDYNIDSLFDLIEASGLEFLGFSNPAVWDLEKLIGNDEELMRRAATLSARDRYRLIEVLDPQQITHYEFFLVKPPFEKETWENDAKLAAAKAWRQPCMDGWESKCFFDYNYQIARIDDLELEFIKACDGNYTVSQIMTKIDCKLELVRSLVRRQIVILQS